MTPHDLFRLEKKLLDLADGKVVPRVVGVHSLAVEGSTAMVIYDIVPDPDGSGLHFSFDFPQTTTLEELDVCAVWLATSGHWMTMH